MNKNLELSFQDGESPAGNIPNGEGAKTNAEQDWQRTQRRMLRYLQMLEIPALETLEIAIEALKRAKQNVTRVHSNPTAESMRALRNLLLEKRYLASSSILSPEYARKHWFGRQNPGQAEIISMPPLKRGLMTSRKG